MSQVIILTFLLLSTPALAHVGDHSAFAIIALLGHFLEWDHILFVIASVLIGWVSYKAGRRAELRSSRAKGPSHDPR